MKPTKAQIYWNTKPMEFVIKQSFNYRMVKESAEDLTYVPRFTLNNSDVFEDFPANEPVKPTEALILKAIKWGMLLEIDYKGEEDDQLEGHNRVIYPLVYGFSKQNKPLIRGYHFKGWSVSGKGNIQKEWRLFRFDRILSMQFTGSFFRLAPDGYKPDDKGIAKIIGAADFNDIRSLQTQLLNQNKIDLKDNMTLNKVKEITAKSTNINITLDNPYKTNLLSKKDAKNTRLTFCKPLADKGMWIVLIGINIDDKQTFKLKVGNKIVGTYTSVKSIMADKLNKKRIEDEYEFKAYIYIDSN